VTAPDRPRPKGFRRVERWFMGVVMGVLAFVLEKVVMRSLRKEGVTPPAEDAGPMITTKGVEVDIEER
jgi:hypothetical protein